MFQSQYLQLLFVPTLSANSWIQNSYKSLDLIFSSRTTISCSCKSTTFSCSRDNSYLLVIIYIFAVWRTLKFHTLNHSIWGGRIVAGPLLPDARPTLPEFDLVIKWPILDDLIKGHQLTIGKGRYHKRETQTARHYREKKQDWKDFQSLKAAKS